MVASSTIHFHDAKHVRRHNIPATSEICRQATDCARQSRKRAQCETNEIERRKDVDGIRQDASARWFGMRSPVCRNSVLGGRTTEQVAQPHERPTHEKTRLGRAKRVKSYWRLRCWAATPLAIQP